MRKKITAGNWKMNLDYDSATSLAREIVQKGIGKGDLMIMAVPFPYLSQINNIVADASAIDVAAQNCHHEVKGAYTGEVSVDMLKSLNIKYCLVGHSERRQIGETDEILKTKIDLCLANGITPIFCCGESLQIREDGTHQGFVQTQLENSLFHLADDDLLKVIIAYEPIWAIGTGKTASAEQAQEMHAHLRNTIAQKYTAAVADGISILYGGSVKPANAQELFANADVDGGLIGGASLAAESFSAISESF